MPDILTQPETVALLAAGHGREAIDTIAHIMRTSQSEKVRLVAAKMLLDEMRGNALPDTQQLQRPALPAADDMREAKTKIVAFIQGHGQQVTVPEVVRATGIKNHIASAVLVQLHSKGAITRVGPGMYRASA